MGPELFLVFLAMAVMTTVIDLVSRRVFGKSVHWAVREGLPRDVMLGQLVMSETPIRTRQPVALHGTPDQVFLNRKGCLVPIDTKLRGKARATHADRMQLSVYATILRHTRAEPVADYGYVRTVTPGHRVRYIKVWLLSERRVIAQQHTVQSKEYA
ncbi:hypothetical protein [Modicisalibacter luteus]|uniref:PD-(D/E)XK endonuclease-like domain-containing protein n=1 Tax=Modicisalibacter luteus TaxID=453962 RepID=A0ABV7LWI0_9GAMM|nr:hypothetical protein [Halomonas lutea]GHB14279.1 hypothetical protein GCM10007159_40830 [Halomonas lutea]